MRFDHMCMRQHTGAAEMSFVEGGSLWHHKRICRGFYAGHVKQDGMSDLGADGCAL
jgi:hypothetical protein